MAADTPVGEFAELVLKLEELAGAIQDEVAAAGPLDLADDARELHRALAAVVVRLRTSRNRAALAELAARAVAATAGLTAAAASDDEVGRILDVEVDAIALLTEASRARVAAELAKATPKDAGAPRPVSQSYLSELRNGKKSLPRLDTAAKLDEHFSTGIRAIIDDARTEIAALRRQRASRPKRSLSRFQPAEPGLRDDLRRQLIQEELARRPELIDVVERVLALGPGHQRVVSEMAESLLVNTVDAPRRRRSLGGGPRR